MAVLASLFKSVSAYGTVQIILGTLVGFLTGIYLPIGMLVKSMQWVIKIFPVSPAALLFRNLMMQRSMDAAFEGAPEELITEIKGQLGVVYFVGDSELALWVSVLYMAVCAVLFFALASVRLSGKRVR